ncbi:hypothetical protein [Emticicia sp.]|uniref:hypothetical protein n=1 Tax=Emticicia sp. TaxID=1930953 RepID=UPI00375190E6
MDYKENFIAKAKNEIQIVKFKDGKYYCFETYYVNIYGDSVLFYNPDNSGFIQYLKYNSKEQNIETPYIIYKQKWNYYQKLINIDSLEFVSEVDNGYNFKILFFYDSLGNEIMQKAIDRGKVNKIVVKKFSIDGKILNFESKDLLRKELINLNYSLRLRFYPELVKLNKKY